jgi:hypothetical protein
MHEMTYVCYCYSCCKGLRVGIYGTTATDWQIVHLPDDTLVIWSSGGKILREKTEDLKVRTVSMPLFPPQVRHGLPWAEPGPV